MGDEEVGMIWKGAAERIHSSIVRDKYMAEGVIVSLRKNCLPGLQ